MNVYILLKYISKLVLMLQGINHSTRLERAGWQVDVGSYSYNNLMKGYDMERFSQEVDHIADAYGIKITSRTMKMEGNSFVFRISNGKSEPNGFLLKRTFSMKAGGLKSVSHDYLTVPTSLQGQNFTKELFASLYKQYVKTGVEEMVVHANISIGSYAWGRYGFMADVRHDGGVQARVISRFFEDALSRSTSADALRKNKELNEIIAYIKTIPDTANLDMNKVSAMAGAKDPLMNKHWWGYLDLRDPARRKIFEDYLAKRK